ncbi:MAG: type II secretion system protein [Candidatus Kerfeldbacteria bacterium]|nr:type II secretion system protein [Candidatus Kerfeldbacteria bacterium]
MHILGSKKNQSGQTLLELIFALGIMITALTATIVLIVSSINASRESRQKLVATSLAREGIELARGIRDSNWVTVQYGICTDSGSGVTNEGLPCTSDSFCGAGTCAHEVWDAGLTGASPAIPVITGSSPYAFDFSVAAFTDQTARIYLNNNFYRQGAGVTGNPTEYHRLVYLNPICHDAGGAERIVDKFDNYTCGQGGSPVAAYPETVGYRIISEVRWPDAASNRKVILEDRLYNWQTL